MKGAEAPVGRAHTLAINLQRIGIVRSCSAERRQLIRDIDRAGGFDQSLRHVRIDIRTSKDHRATAQVDTPVLPLIDARRVGRMGHVHGDGDLRVNTKCAGSCTPQSDLFGDGGDGVNRTLQPGPTAPQRFDDDP